VRACSDNGLACEGVLWVELRDEVEDEGVRVLVAAT